MNIKERELAKKGLNNIEASERQRIIRLVADVKRCGDVLSLLPEAIDEYRASSENFISKYKLGLTKEDVSFCWLADSAGEREAVMAIRDIDKLLDAIPESYYWYMSFYEDKLKYREWMRNVGCLPENEKFRIWRQRQINRCDGELGGLNRSFVHTVCCYEMAVGCSVNCSFCGLSAGRLRSLFRYNDENAELFRGVLSATKEVIGPAAGYGMMYFATEPLDNPDYEKFEDIYYDVFGILPQITTAVADRNIERVRALVDELNEKRGHIHRFTILSQKMACNILNAFDSTELLRVELLPQYPEAPGFVGFTKVGRQLEETSDVKETDVGTIVCVDGFCINFCEKSIEMFTPCRVSENNSKGIACQDKIYFTNAEDYREKLIGLIDRYAVNELADDFILRFYSYFELKGDGLHSNHGGETLYFSKMPDYARKIITLIATGTYNKLELVKKMSKEEKVSPENTFFIINQLWKMGFIREEVFRTDE